MTRSAFLAVCFCLVWTITPALSAATIPPPRDSAVLRALPKPPVGSIRLGVRIVKESVTAKQWKCTVCYTEGILTPWGPIPLGKPKTSVVYVEVADAVARR